MIKVAAAALPRLQHQQRRSRPVTILTPTSAPLRKSRGQSRVRRLQSAPRGWQTSVRRWHVTLAFELYEQINESPDDRTRTGKRISNCAAQPLSGPASAP